MSLLLWALSVPFLLKIGYNLVLPYDMLRRLHQDPETKDVAVSLMPGVEWFFFLLVAVVSFFADQNGVFQFPRILWIGGGLIVGSYIHMAAIGFLGGLLMAFINRNSAPSNGD